MHAPCTICPLYDLTNLAPFQCTFSSCFGKSQPEGRATVMITMTSMIPTSSRVSFQFPFFPTPKAPLSFEHSHVVGKCLAVNFRPAHRSSVSTTMWLRDSRLLAPGSGCYLYPRTHSPPPFHPLLWR